MEILDFFTPVDTARLLAGNEYDPASWLYGVDMYNGEAPDLFSKKIAILGIDDESGDNASYNIRKYLYQLKKAEYAGEIIDLGDFKFNYRPKDYESLGFVISELITNNL